MPSSTKINVKIYSEDLPSWETSEGTQGGAIAEFTGVVRGTENGSPISALEYEAYQPMAEREIEGIIKSLLKKLPCLSVFVAHRIGRIPVGEAAIKIQAISLHRVEAFSLIQELMNEIKKEVPIWKAKIYEK